MFEDSKIVKFGSAIEKFFYNLLIDKSYPNILFYDLSYINKKRRILALRSRIIYKFFYRICKLYTNIYFAFKRFKFINGMKYCVIQFKNRRLF